MECRHRVGSIQYALPSFDQTNITFAFHLLTFEHSMHQTRSTVIRNTHPSTKLDEWQSYSTEKFLDSPHAVAFNIQEFQRRQFKIFRWQIHFINTSKYFTTNAIFLCVVFLKFIYLFICWLLVPKNSTLWCSKMEFRQIVASWNVLESAQVECHLIKFMSNSAKYFRPIILILLWISSFFSLILEMDITGFHHFSIFLCNVCIPNVAV